MRVTESKTVTISLDEYELLKKRLETFKRITNELIEGSNNLVIVTNGYSDYNDADDLEIVSSSKGADRVMEELNKFTNAKKVDELYDYMSGNRDKMDWYSKEMIGSAIGYGIDRVTGLKGLLARIVKNSILKSLNLL